MGFHISFQARDITVNTTQIKLRFLPPALHIIPAGFRGKTRAARYLLGSALDASDVTVTGYDKSRFLVPSAREPIGLHLIIDGVYEKPSLDFILKNLPQAGTFLDVGANIGTFAVTVARFLSGAGKVIAIEPSAAIVPYLKNNIRINGLENVKVLECAVTDEDDRSMPFYEPPKEHFGMGSISRQFHDNPVLVRTRMLDTIIQEEQIRKVSVIKVDVEGHEAAVFKGSRHLLTSDRAPIVIFEFCDWAEARAGISPGKAQNILREYGYRIWRLSDIVKKAKRPLTDTLTKGGEMLVAVK